MRKFTSILLYFVAGLPLLLGFLLMASLKPWALDGDFWKKTLTDDRLYSILLSPELRKDVDERLLLGGYTLSGPALVEALQKEAPVAELKALTARGVDGLLPAVDRAPSAKRELDLRGIKKALAAKSAALATDYVSALPLLAQRPAPKDLSFRPQGLAESLVVARAREAVAQVLDSEIPDQVVWPPQESLARSELDLVLADLGPRRIDLATGALGLGSALVITLLSLIGAGSLGKRLSLAGAYVLAPSILILVIGSILSTGSTFVVGSLGLPGVNLPAVSGSVEGSRLISWAADSVAGAAKSFFIVGLGGSFLGGLLLALRKFFDRTDTDL